MARLSRSMGAVVVLLSCKDTVPGDFFGLSCGMKND